MFCLLGKPQIIQLLPLARLLEQAIEKVGYIYEHVNYPLNVHV